MFDIVCFGMILLFWMLIDIIMFCGLFDMVVVLWIVLLMIIGVILMLVLVVMLYSDEF